MRNEFDGTSEQVAVVAIRAALSCIHDDVAKIREDANAYEIIFDVRPHDARFCSFWLGVGTYGSYDVGFGHGLLVEELTIAEYPPDCVIRAILDDSVRETVWFRRGKAIRATGTVTLQDGRNLSDDATLTPFGFIGGTAQIFDYERYPIALD